MRSFSKQPKWLCDDSGSPLLVVRPADGPKAVARSRELVGLQGAEGALAFGLMLKEQVYTFRGFAVDDRAGESGDIYICDADGVALEQMQPGDSFVSGPEVAPPIGAVLDFGAKQEGSN